MAAQDVEARAASLEARAASLAVDLAVLDGMAADVLFYYGALDAPLEGLASVERTPYRLYGHAMKVSRRPYPPALTSLQCAPNQCMCVPGAARRYSGR
jgi:hypothetical protein